MRFSYIFLIFGFVACKQGATPNDYKGYHETFTVREVGNVDQVIQKLYLDYESEPTTQEAKDQNLIIDYLAEHQISATRLPSGVYFKVYTYGDGDPFFFGRKFLARYTGYFLDGQVFDSNIKADEPLKASVGQMIPGWNEILTHLAPGSKVSMFIPSHLAYGKNGKGAIPPNSVLIFDVDLVF